MSLYNWLQQSHTQTCTQFGIPAGSHSLTGCGCRVGTDYTTVRVTQAIPDDMCKSHRDWLTSHRHLCICRIQGMALSNLVYINAIMKAV